MQVTHYCRYLLLLLFLVSTKSLVLRADAIAPETADNIYEQAKDVALHLRTMDYSFRVSHYGAEVQRIRVDGIKARVDARVPEKVATGMAVGEIIDAFNGELYQRISGSARQLAVSRISVSGDTGVIGPCLTPLEECYRWLKRNPSDSIWFSMGKDSAWDSFKPNSNFEPVVIGDRQCFKLNFIRDNGVQFNLYISHDLNWFPVRTEIFSPNGALAGVTIASQFKRFATGGSKESWLPQLVEVDSQSSKDGPINSHVRYEILTDTASVGDPIDPAIFTLGYDKVDYIYDLDSSEVYNPDSSIRTKINKSQSTPLTQNAAPNKSSRLRYLLLLNALVIFVIIGMVGWRIMQKHA